jgi:hypothetical protein
LEIAIRSFRPEVQSIAANLVFHDGAGIRADAFKVTEPPEIAEAWENLDVFPRRLIREIATIRASIRRVDEILSEVSPDRLLFGDAMQKDTRFNVLHESIRAISEACGIISDGLGPEIERLAPRLPEQERMLALYGEPDIEGD